MKLPDRTKALRAALNIGKHCTAEEHRAEISAVREEHPHSIKFVAARIDETCAPYALGITDNPTYRALAWFCDVYAGKDFMEWAIQNRLRPLLEPQIGCLACYFDGEDWKHVGVATAPGRAISKWGKWPIYEHDLAEASDEFGDCVRFFERPSPAQAMTWILDFAAHQGVTAGDVSEAVRLHQRAAEW
jgi:hypothetical protein